MLFPFYLNVILRPQSNQLFVFSLAVSPQDVHSLYYVYTGNPPDVQKKHQDEMDRALPSKVSGWEPEKACIAKDLART